MIINTTSQADLNIFTFALQHSDGQAVLEVEGSYHVADMITKFLPGVVTLYFVMIYKTELFI